MDSAHETEQSERRAIADAIEANRTEIVRRWLERVRADFVGRDISRSQLRNAIGSYLTGLARAMRNPQTIDTARAELWAEVAREHAETRVRLGFDVDQLVHEFILLRGVLSAVLREVGVRPDDLQWEMLTDLIEAAIANSVRRYAEGRDEEAHRQEAQNLAFVTHELRSPLSAAMAATAQLRRSAASGAPPSDRMLALVERSHTRLMTLIDRVLLVERLEAGEAQVQLADVTLDEILEPVLATARPLAEAKGLTLEARYDARLAVRVDPRLVTSAAQNLIDNAVKYTDAGSIEVAVTADGAEWHLDVHDHCAGLSAEELSVIFEPFRRGRSQKPGTGLGLAIARRAVDAQGGTITAQSPPGEAGCHFRLTMPRFVGAGTS